MTIFSISRVNLFRCAFFIIIPLLFILYPPLVFSQEDLPVPPEVDDALEEELRYLKAETYVITASRVKENIKKDQTDGCIRQTDPYNHHGKLKRIGIPEDPGPDHELYSDK